MIKKNLKILIIILNILNMSFCSKHRNYISEINQQLQISKTENAVKKLEHEFNQNLDNHNNIQNIENKINKKIKKYNKNIKKIKKDIESYTKKNKKSSSHNKYTNKINKLNKKLKLKKSKACVFKKLKQKIIL